MRLCVNFKNKRNIKNYIQQKRNILRVMFINKGTVIPEDTNIPEQPGVPEQTIEPEQLILNDEPIVSEQIVLREQTIWYKTNSPNNVIWISITSDSNCKYIYALSKQGIYKSTDYGNAWTISLTNENEDTQWVSVCSDMSGKYIVAFAIINTSIRQNILYYSNNFGEIWNTSSHTINSTDYLTSITYNDKPSFISVSFNGRIYESVNYGESWSKISAINTLCSSILSNYNNKFLYVSSCYGNRGIYISNDYGKTWKKQCNLICNLLAGSFCCKYLVATCNTKNMEGIHVSNDYGQTWTKTLSIKGYWSSIVSNYSGKYLGAICKSDEHGGIYLSYNYGISWIKNDTTINDTTIDDLNYLILSDNGSLLFASASNCQNNTSNIYLYKNLVC
jgi:photosystem II stability/assembly factor-like uncharacterized protein